MLAAAGRGRHSRGMTSDAASRRTLLLFALASLAAVAAGAATLAAAGQAPGAWLRNPIAWAVAALLGAGLYAGGRVRWVRLAPLVIAPAAIALTLLAEPVDGVHRWIGAGPLHVNVAALVVPSMIVAAAFAGIRSHLGLGASGAAAIVLFLQPDASQVTALAAAAGLLALRSEEPLLHRAAIASAFAGATLAAWDIPAPTLQPVAEVEGIFGLAWATVPMLAGFAALALAASAAAPLSIAGRGRRGDAALALCAYFAVTALAPLAGAYPVPLVGLGMSFPVGWWLGIALLAGVDKEAASG